MGGSYVAIAGHWAQELREIEVRDGESRSEGLLGISWS